MGFVALCLPEPVMSWIEVPQATHGDSCPLGREHMRPLCEPILRLQFVSVLVQ